MDELSRLGMEYPGLLPTRPDGWRAEASARQRILLEAVESEFDILWVRLGQNADAEGFGPGELLGLENMIGLLLALPYSSIAACHLEQGR